MQLEILRHYLREINISSIVLEFILDLRFDFLLNCLFDKFLMVFKLGIVREASIWYYNSWYFVRFDTGGSVDDMFSLHCKFGVIDGFCNEVFFLCCCWIRRKKISI